MKIESNASLKKFNTFGVECAANQLIHVESNEDLRVLFDQGIFANSSPLILGGGSNILLTKTELEKVIIIEIPGKKVIKSDQKNTWIFAGAGVTWDDVVQYAITQKLGGIENLSIIPGKAGTAPMQNIGAYGSELVDVFEELAAFNKLSGEFEIFSKDKCQFGYRNSFFKNDGKNKYIITDITLRLNNDPVFNTSYGTVEATLKEMGIKTPTLETMRQAIIKIRTSKLPDPNEIGNAGSFFKNPTLEPETFENLKQDFPAIPGYHQADDRIKIPAGWLIENCGWKGQRIGNTGIHDKQALVIVNYGNATGEEILNLSQEVQNSVKEKFGILLEAEVNVI